jgi:hypothetical protein
MQGESPQSEKPIPPLSRRVSYSGPLNGAIGADELIAVLRGKDTKALQQPAAGAELETCGAAKIDISVYVFL